MKKALILGVGDAQVDAIRYLKKDGWWVIGCSYRYEGRGIQLVDQFELVDITDHLELEKLGRKEGIDLIYSVGSDLAIPAVAKVASKLDLPSFVSAEAAELIQNKAKLRDLLAANNISPVKYKKVSSETDLEGWDSFPAMVKPADSQGQRGVFLADSIQEIKTGLEKSLSFSRSKTGIIEEFLGGPEVNAIAFVVDSKVVFNEISDRLTAPGYPCGIAHYHVLPSRNCLGATLRETKAVVERCIQALAIENGPVYFQLKLTANGPKVLEIAPRLDGGHIWRLVKTVGDVDLLEACFKWLTGTKSMNFQMSSRMKRHRVGFLLYPPGKVFRKIIHPIPGQITHLEYYYKDGEVVRVVNGLLEKVGYYIEKL